MVSIKSQISSQIFIYILAAVLAGVILLIGYKAIGTITAQANEKELRMFFSDLENAAERATSNSAGSQNSFQLLFSREYEEICFSDAKSGDSFDAAIISAAVDYPIIKSGLASGESKNVWLLSKKMVLESTYIPNLDVESDFLCLKNKGKLVVWFRSAGTKAVLYT